MTFITPDEDKYAPDLVKALTDSNQVVPPALQALATQHLEKVASGEAQKRVSGYRGTGFKHDITEAVEALKVRALRSRVVPLRPCWLYCDARAELSLCAVGVFIGVSCFVVRPTV